MIDNKPPNVHILREMVAVKAKTEGRLTAEIRQKGSRYQLLDYLERDIWPTFPKLEAVEDTVLVESLAVTVVEPVKDSLPVVQVEIEPVKEPLPVSEILPAPVKGSLPVKQKRGDQKGMLANGRSKKGVPKFENWFGQVYPKDFTYPSWRYLTKTATDLAIICMAKSGRAASWKQKNAAGNPVFDFTVSEAVNFFKLTRPTFLKAIHLLLEIGFIKYSRYGGICDGNGIKAEYILSEEWKTWVPPARDNSNMAKARSMLAVMKTESQSRGLNQAR